MSRGLDQALLEFVKLSYLRGAYFLLSINSKDILFVFDFVFGVFGLYLAFMLINKKEFIQSLRKRTISYSLT